MDFGDWVGVARDFGALLGLALAAWFSVRVFLRFSPLLTLRVSPQWADEDETVLLIRLELGNESRVRTDKPKVFLQVLEHAIPTEGGSISEWLAFDEDDLDKCTPVLEWRPPVRVFTSTDQIRPGEVIVIERLHHCPQRGVVFHVGLQVRHEQARRVGLWVPPPQTTTCLVTRGHVTNASDTSVT
jgi:hypothetical protein